MDPYIVPCAHQYGAMQQATPHADTHLLVLDGRSKLAQVDGPNIGSHTMTRNGWFSLERNVTPPPPDNTMLRHLRMPSHHEDTQDNPNELDFRLGLNWSSHPYLAKWLALHKSKKKGQAAWRWQCCCFQLYSLSSSRFLTRDGRS